MKGVRTRFAPSPTGRLHLGNARTALFNWLYARAHGGDFVLRMEDTDTARSSAAHEASIRGDLEWLGLVWDEGPVKGGPLGPYRQSERLSVYAEAAERLLASGAAYRCLCSKERLEELKRAQAAKGEPPRYDGRCRGLNAAGSASSVVRFRIPEKKLRFADLVHGEIEFDSHASGDFVVMGSDGMASYNFAVVVDDALMGITDVIRGDDHLSNTPRQLLLYEALGFTPPRFAHLPLVLGPDRAPLSKRHGAFSIGELREEGFLPEALANAAARLSWSPGEGLIAIDELAKRFSIEKVSKAAAIFDPERLRAFNKEAIGKASAKRLASLAPSGLGGERLSAVIEAVKANASTLKELWALAGPFLGPLDVTETPGLDPGAKAVIRALREEVEGLTEIDPASFKSALERVKARTGAKGKDLMMPVRLALTGAREGIELAVAASLLGREETIKRLGRYEA